jgi:hypothetical protein
VDPAIWLRWAEVDLAKRFLPTCVSPRCLCLAWRSCGSAIPGARGPALTS